MNLTLQKRRLHGETLKDLDLRGLDLSNAQAHGATIEECTFTDCDFSLADLSGVTFEGCSFIHCDLRMTNFHMSKIRRVRFERCDLRRAIFAGVHPIDRVVFEECELQYSSFAESTIRAAAWLRSNLHGADLRFMECNEANFEGSNLWNAQVRIGCTFWSSHFDARNADLFVAMAARLHPDTGKANDLQELAGPAYNTLTRLMESRDPL